MGQMMPSDCSRVYLTKTSPCVTATHPGWVLVVPPASVLACARAGLFHTICATTFAAAATTSLRVSASCLGWVKYTAIVIGGCPGG
jgi:hypothetical protein